MIVFTVTKLTYDVLDLALMLHPRDRRGEASDEGDDEGEDDEGLDGDAVHAELACS